MEHVFFKMDNKTFEIINNQILNFLIKAEEAEEEESEPQSTNRFSFVSSNVASFFSKAKSIFHEHVADSVFQRLDRLGLWQRVRDRLHSKSGVEIRSYKADQLLSELDLSAADLSHVALPFGKQMSDSTLKTFTKRVIELAKKQWATSCEDAKVSKPQNALPLHFQLPSVLPMLCLCCL